MGPPLPLGSRRLGLALILVLCALAGAWAAPRIAGPATYATTVADVQLRLSVAPPGDRGLNLYVPLADWGLRSRVVDAPVLVSAEPRRINRDAVVGIVTDGGTGAVGLLRGELDEALRSAAVRFGLVSLAGALAGGVVALLAWHAAGVRGRRLLLAPAGAVALTLALGGGLAAWAAASFDATKLERPDYYASGAELERILAQADALRHSAEEYSSRVDNAVLAIAGLLGERGDDRNPLAPPAGVGRTRRLVLASDMHSNVLTLPTLRRYARGHLTVLAGDFTVNGSRLEAPLIAGVAKVGHPVVAVSGNHDSPGIMRALARRGAIVLDHGDGVRRIAGVSMAGFEDPLMFGGGDFPDGLRAGLSFTDLPHGHERFLEAVAERWRWWQTLPERPAVLVLHQAAIGRALAELIWQASPEGPPLTILVGHTHRQRLDRYGAITVVDAGTIGAGGLFGIGTQDVGLALLDLREDGTLEATDLVAQDPATSAAQARRVITSSPDCDGRLVVCHTEPHPPRLPGATPTPEETAASGP